MTRSSLFVFLLLMFSCVAAQTTTGSINGIIKTNTGEILKGVTIRIIHEPTGTTYFSQTGKTGHFAIPNLSPGGPYRIEASFVNFDTEKKNDITVGLGENITIDLILSPLISLLQQVTVSTVKRPDNFLGNTGAVIDKDKMEKLPAAGRNIYEYLRTVPQAKLVEGNEGAVSFAGQNNRYNAFYVDGSVSNDVFGLAASGTNGGQAGISPLSIDAIGQFQVVISPYDASLGNFTGAAINAVTRSGSNRKQSSFYHFFSNRNLTGKTPTGIKEAAVKLDNFSADIYGLRLQGAVIQNKLFYFANIELQRENYSQPFSFYEYKGNTKDVNLLTILANTIKGTYQYDPGTFLDNIETVNADRIVTRFDWNINKRNSVSLSNRYMYAQRMNTNASNATTIHFSNDGYAFFSRSNSVSVEFKSSIHHRAANKLLITYNDVKDDREPLQKAFPRVRINDGEGAFIFGTDNSSTINLLTQKNWTLFDKYTFTMGRHALNFGVDLEYNQLFNAFIQNSFGSYTYFALEDFLTNRRPSAYQSGFSMIDDVKTDHTKAAAKFSVLKTAAFINDEMRYDRLVFSYGLRIDHHRFLNSPVTDEYTNSIALPAFEKYYDLEGARSGLRTVIPVSVSPRIGFTYRLPKQNSTLRGGLGIFSGRLPFAWPGGSYNNNGSFIGGFTANISQLNTIRFRPDPSHQWTVAELGATTNKEPLNLTTARFSMPKLLRTSIAWDKKAGNGWAAGFEAMYSKNITEIKYTNINILPPALQATGADNRKIYSAVNNARIPLNADGSNPYGYAILLGNNKRNTGYAYDLTASLTGLLYKWELEINYHFGRSIVTNDGTSSVNTSQWRTMETVNGRNELPRSVSDFSPGHRLYILLNRSFHHRLRSMTTAISFAYTIQSGSPVSYVYGNYSMARDDGVFGNYDLVYIPSVKDLEEMIFLPDTVNGIIYSPQQQKEALENYIRHDRYLRTHRGTYAERNGSRTPFTSILDLKIKHNIRIRQYEIQLTCDIYNFTNLLNRNWGRRYYQPGDNLVLMDFAGYLAPTDPRPQYRSNPMLIPFEKWNVSESTTPAYSARWNVRLGARITF